MNREKKTGKQKLGKQKNSEKIEDSIHISEIQRGSRWQRGFFIYLLFSSYYKQGLKRLSQAQEDQGQSIVAK